MLFNSFEFLLFFPLVTITYFLLPHRFRWLLVLSASCYFYMAFVPKYIFILATTITIDYFAGLGLEKFKGRNRKWLLLASILSNIGMLAFFKYFNFANENLTLLANFIGWNYPIKDLEIILPIGLSFHTFQSLSYTIEVYRGKFRAERHFGYLATYVMFYPQLVAGPIERPQNILPQLHTEQEFNYQRVTDGLKWMAWGMFKKVAIADRIALFVNPVYNAPNQYSGPALLVATLAFAIQIYCDFSGYSDIALGSAQVMGIQLMKNFNHPYFSKSVSEFWQRWHISLSTWFRDYLYIPLGGNRVKKTRWAFNLFATFLVSGLWHGANWTFVIWGALHGLFVLLSNLTAEMRGRLFDKIKINWVQQVAKIMPIPITFILVSYAWIFFRANSLNDALYISSHLFHGWPEFLSQTVAILKPGVGSNRRIIIDALFSAITPLTSQPRSAILLTAIAMFLLFIVEINQYRNNFLEQINRLKPFNRIFLYAMLVTLILVMGTQYTGNDQSFIYFQF
jgi:alginate O-acetyltransferase complex protein AlgI